MANSAPYRFAYCASLLWLAGGPFRVAAQNPAGMIEHLTGDVSIVLSTGLSERLDVKKSLGRLVYPGEKIKCGAGGTATLRVNVPFTDKALMKCPEQGQTIEFDPPGTGHSQQTAAAAHSGVDVLQKYKIAGRDKGSDSPIYNPPEDGAVIASEFIVRWRTRPVPPKFIAILRDGTGRELARADGANAESGVLDSPALREALVKYRDTGGEHRARLVFQSATGSENGVAFTVLTKEQEGALNDALSKQSAPAGLFHHVERAAIFDSFRLYGPVASEYDAALRQAPESLELLRAAVTAYSKIGDLRRARELRDALDKLETPGGKQ